MVTRLSDHIFSQSQCFYSNLYLPVQFNFGNIIYTGMYKIDKRILEYIPRIPIKSEAFLGAFSKYQMEESKVTIEISQFLNDKRFPVNDVGATYRVINHWDSMGLLGNMRENNDQSWRKFSLVDIVWVKVLQELRKYGLSLEQLKQTYQSAFFHPAITEQKWKMFEFSICACLFHNAMIAVIFEDGLMEILPKAALSVNGDFGIFKAKSCLLLNLNRCVQEVMPTMNLHPEGNVRFSLNEKDSKVFTLLFDNEISEITVMKKNGAIDRIETKKKSLGNTQRIMNLLQGVQFGEVKIKKENGKIVFTEVTKKECVS